MKSLNNPIAKINLEFLGHVFKNKQQYGMAVFAFYTLLFFIIGLLIGFLFYIISLKLNRKIKINPFTIGFWIANVGAYLSSDYLYINKKSHIFLDKSILLVLIILGFYILSSIIGDLISWYIHSKNHEAPSSMLKASIVIIITLIGLFIAFQSIGLSITPLITTLGISTVVIGLALQDTLSNFLSGFYIIMSKQLRIGDYIKFDNYEGYVEDIYWRSTYIRTLSGNLIAIPNSKITSSVVTNYHLPYQSMSVILPISVSYKEDLKKVEDILIKVAKETLDKLDGADKTLEPFVRYSSFGASGINLNLIFKVREFKDQYLITHELIKAIKQTFDKEGIEIPYQTIKLVDN